MSEPIKRKNANIELLRVTACIMVVLLHALRMTYGIQTVIEDAIRAMVMPAVGIFWMVTGYFFFYDQKPYLIRVKKTLKEILLPTIIVIVVTNFFIRWIIGETTLYHCIRYPEFDFRAVFGGILNWSTSTIQVASHFWYVFAYLRLVIWFPLIRYICKNQPTENKIRRAYLILYFIRACIYDAQFLILPFLGFNRGMKFFLPIDINLWFVLIGYEARLWIEKEEKEAHSSKRRFWIAVLGLGISYLMAFICVRICRQYQLKESYFTSVDTALVMMAAAAIFYIGMKVKVPVTVAKVVGFLGKKTFYVYLIHHAILRKIIKSESIRTMMESRSPFERFLVNSGLGIVISFVGVILFDFIIKKIKKHT